nr:E3 ubiquitin-protein ligase NHLRC1-like [Misgurnus anguillicaudatus]
MSDRPVSPHSDSSTRAEDILTEIRVNLLECKVCFESFSVQKRDHTPLNLPCGHVLCLTCVCTLTHPVHHRLECPFCRKVCEAGSTSQCRALVDLQDLLHTQRSRRLPVLQQLISWTQGLGSRALDLHSAFGGWGLIINPSGIAVDESSGEIIVVHDGEKRVAVFSRHGTSLRAFGCYGHGPADVCHPLDVAVVSSGHLVITDAGDGTVKVFDSTGCPVLTVRDSFKLPWSVDIDGCGWILVTDAQMGTLNQLVLDFDRGAVLVNRVVLKDLMCPRSVACDRISGNIAVVDHLEKSGVAHGNFAPSCLKIYNGDFVLLTVVDSFGLNLMDSVCISISSVVFDRNGDVIVGDTQRGMVWSLGKPQISAVLTPLVSGLLCPAGLTLTADNELIVLDSGDHTVKFYTEYTEDLYSESK